MSGPAEVRVRVRRAGVADLPQVARLAAEHAEFERAAAPPPDLARRLERLLFGTPSPRLRCFVAELDETEIIGYASCAPEVSTWDGAEYLHMDCLFLREGHRGLKVGPLLVAAVVAEARALGLEQVQWQTPPWNTDAIRFYDRLGARAKEKVRFHLEVGGGS
ncbi:GNAT family N-acetyltransferase [Streptomyces roseirectus]|uniref:GNAT family N-acetyltransferase n=1 Tax=Streptomyces roseirectus TaxID=2768066 RepID=A0A7H0IJ89_9ACTN|nr:GNAT family N-acetyltransferase [Streptomyces roseirectus]QNP72855.1 GNAT family N-acetyltransferase [Streptomyces roseirectus]